MAKYNIGDWVEKFSGDYTFQGIIIAVAEKTSGETRYNVELKCDCPADGMVHIFSESQLRPWTPPAKTIEHLVARKLLQRREFGLQKYGKGLEHRDDIDFVGWLVHLQEECLDAANYIRVLLQRLSLCQTLTGEELQKHLKTNFRHLLGGY